MLTLAVQDDEHVFPTWDTNYIRTLQFVNGGDVTLKDIPCRDYVISNSTWDPDEAMGQTIKGFANLSGFENGSQVRCWRCCPSSFVVDGFCRSISPIRICGMRMNCT